MASRQQGDSWTSETICSICLDFFTDPVMLECGHNFCRYCIFRCWENKDINLCPECRERILEKNLKVNRALANLAEKARLVKQNQKEIKTKRDCAEHREGLKLFCETDKKLICFICRDSREHKSHNFLPIKEAVEIYKSQLKSCTDNLKMMKSEVLERELQQKGKIYEIREQANRLQTLIMSEFTKMHQILTEKEQRLLRELREEERRIREQMEKNLLGIQDNLKYIQDSLTLLQKQMEEEDELEFLKEEVCRKGRVGEERQILSVVDLTLPTIKFDRLLQYTTWRKMIDSINPAPASVTLDPNTANPWLVLSEDRTSVRLGGIRRQLPDTPTRFDQYACVLGAEGFTSGKHYWEVRVGNKTEWRLGVAQESINRKRGFNLRSDSGCWLVWLKPRKGYVAGTSPSETSLTSAAKPRKIGVYLDYEGGQVSFYNADNMSHLYTFTHTFTERVFPIYFPGLNIDCKNAAPLIICGASDH
ncbi:zinc-binding protein A33-like [Stegostoma tigrinum]|uniref:zinc-binding protein A33-like n=1 Tax=Stegostoma tigrinum TaxID=3053191 RepID=UPI00202B2952|nr:zinc-binding protein A33-like [Stegostoma tigrinum]